MGEVWPSVHTLCIIIHVCLCTYICTCMCISTCSWSLLVIVIMQEQYHIQICIVWWLVCYRFLFFRSAVDHEFPCTEDHIHSTILIGVLSVSTDEDHFKSTDTWPTHSVLLAHPLYIYCMLSVQHREITSGCVYNFYVCARACMHVHNGFIWFHSFVKT